MESKLVHFFVASAYATCGWLYNFSRFNIIEFWFNTRQLSTCATMKPQLTLMFCNKLESFANCTCSILGRSGAAVETWHFLLIRWRTVDLMSQSFTKKLIQRETLINKRLYVASRQSELWKRWQLWGVMTVTWKSRLWRVHWNMTCRFWWRVIGLWSWI